MIKTISPNLILVLVFLTLVIGGDVFMFFSLFTVVWNISVTGYNKLK